MPVFIVYFALLAVAFFFLIVRPQRRQLAARRALIQAVEVGDEIITVGGVYGVVLSIEEDTLRVEIAPGVVMTLAREAVARRRDDDAPPSVSIQPATVTEGDTSLTDATLSVDLSAPSGKPVWAHEFDGAKLAVPQTVRTPNDKTHAAAG